MCLIVYQARTNARTTCSARAQVSTRTHERMYVRVILSHNAGTNAGELAIVPAPLAKHRSV